MKNAKFVRDVVSRGRDMAPFPWAGEVLPGVPVQAGINYDEGLEYAVPIEVVHAR